MITEEKIAETFVSTLNGIMTLYLDEAESSDYPYGVYAITQTYNRTKDGLSSITASITLMVVSKDFDEADTLTKNALAAVEDAMNSDSFFAQAVTKQPNCVDGIWIIETNYTIKQVK